MKAEHVVVYGKAGCPGCEQAKQFFADRNQPIRYLTLGVDYERDELLAKFPFVRAVPVITILGQYIPDGIKELHANWASLVALSDEKCDEIAKAYEEIAGGIDSQ